MHAYWAAAAALNGPRVSAADRSWLGLAPQVACREVHNRKGRDPLFSIAIAAPLSGKDEATDQAGDQVEDQADAQTDDQAAGIDRGLTLDQLIAFRAVKRGLTSREPGSDHDIVERDLTETGGGWIERLAVARPGAAGCRAASIRAPA